MKITFFVIGLFVAVIAIIIDTQNGRGDSMGYFLLSSAMMISSAIWKTDRANVDYYRSMQKVYTSLAEGAIDMDTLMQRVMSNSKAQVLSEHYQAVIGRMLSKRQIIIINGLVTIGDGVDTVA